MLVQNVNGSRRLGGISHSDAISTLKELLRITHSSI
jgi:hypothetical protein